MKWPNIWGLLLRANGNHLLKIVKPQIFGHTLLKSIDIALRKFPQPYYDIESVNFWPKYCREIITCNSKSLKLSYQSAVGKSDSESSNMSNPWHSVTLLLGYLSRLWAPCVGRAETVFQGTEDLCLIAISPYKRKDCAAWTVAGFNTVAPPCKILTLGHTWHCG